MAELSKSINKSKNSAIPAYNVARIEDINQGWSLRETKKLAIGRGRMYAVRNEAGNATKNTDEITKGSMPIYALATFDKEAVLSGLAWFMRSQQ